MSQQTDRLIVEGFFEPVTSTVSYLVCDAHSMCCAVIDSVLDFDAASGRTHTSSADQIVARVQALGAQVQWVLETHLHADHLSAAPYVLSKLGGRLGVGRHITTVQRMFGTLFNAGPEFASDGSQFQHLFDDDEVFSIGGLQARALHTPGHTPACVSYVVGTHDAAVPDGAVVFVGDTLFMPDHGTARCDFPGGDAATLYRSIHRLLALPPATRLYLCHDYQPGGRPVCFVSTVAEQRADNIHVGHGIGEAEFVALRTARDATLGTPQLMLPAVQVNMRGGQWPEPESNGVRYLKIPIDAV